MDCGGGAAAGLSSRWSGGPARRYRSPAIGHQPSLGVGQCCDVSSAAVVECEAPARSAMSKVLGWRNHPTARNEKAWSLIALIRFKCEDLHACYQRDIGSELILGRLGVREAEDASEQSIEIRLKLVSVHLAPYA
jgi:hypothetical protein